MGNEGVGGGVAEGAGGRGWLPDDEGGGWRCHEDSRRKMVARRRLFCPGFASAREHWSVGGERGDNIYVVVQWA
jgi:hypothetical protein